MRRHVLLPVVIAAGSLLGCQNQDAADHRAAIKALDEIRADLQATEPGSASLTGLVTRLKAIRTGGKGVEAMRDRLLTEAQTRLAQDTWDAAANARREAVELAGTIASLADGAGHASIIIDASDRTASTLGADDLANRRVAQASRKRDIGDQMGASRPAMDQIKATNREDMAKAVELRMQAAGLRDQAEATNPIAGHPLRTRAAALDHQAALIEATVERRLAVLEMQHQPTWELLELSHQGLNREIEAIDAQSEAIEALASSWHAQQESARGRIGDIDTQLRDAAQALAQVLGGPLSNAWTTATGHLDKAAAAARKATRNGGRDSRDADTLMTIQVQVASLGMSVAQSELVGRCIELLDAVATDTHLTASTAWQDQRQVLESALQVTTQTARAAGEDAMQLADGLGVQGQQIRSSIEAVLQTLPAPPTAQK